MTLDHSTILQVNATMIVGILIFLSFSSSMFGTISESDVVMMNETMNMIGLPDIPIPVWDNVRAKAEAEASSYQVFATVITLVPFTASSLTVVMYEIKRAQSAQLEKPYIRLSLLLMTSGFVILIVVLLSLVYANQQSLFNGIDEVLETAERAEFNYSS